MKLSLREDEVMADFILDYSDHCLCGPERFSFRELMRMDTSLQRAVNASDVIPAILKKLPKKRVSDRFDRKMAAAFAQELEKEKADQNLKQSHSSKTALSASHS